jgi:hypothetical protein
MLAGPLSAICPGDAPSACTRIAFQSIHDVRFRHSLWPFCAKPSIFYTWSLLCVEGKSGRILRVKYWEILADNLSKAGWSWGSVSPVDPNGQTIFIADAASVGSVVPGDQLQTLHKDHVMGL